MGRQKLDVLLYGSCVSRDLQEQWSDRFYRRAYIARQSLISAMTPAYIYRGEHRLDSPWQHRMVKGDLASNLLVRLAEDAPRTDVLIWDLTDERMGVQPLGDGTYGTITPDSLRSGILAAFEDEGEPIRFGTRRHLMLWEAALTRFIALLDAVGLRERSYVLSPQWADADDGGAPVEHEADRSAQDWARAYQPYLRRIEEAGIAVIPLPEELVRTTPEHRWGPAPYHYVDGAYRHWAEEIEARLHGDGKRTVHDPLPEPGEDEPEEELPDEPRADGRDGGPAVAANADPEGVAPSWEQGVPAAEAPAHDPADAAPLTDDGAGRDVTSDAPVWASAPERSPAGS